MKTVNTSSKSSKASKASKNTPINTTTFESYVSRMSDTAKAKALVKAKARIEKARIEKARSEENATVKAKPKGGIYALIAGTVRAINHKGMSKAIAYHTANGNLTRTTDGIALTQKGAMLFKSQRVNNAPQQFQAIATMLHSNGAILPAWSRQPVTFISEKVRFPNQLYWGSFSSGLMRQAFAAVWAGK